MILIELRGRLAWGWRMLDYLGFDTALRASGLPQPGSNRGYWPEQLIVQFMLSGWCGANRFEHGEVTHHDPVLRRLFGFKRMANFKAVMRLFRKFTQADNERVLGGVSLVVRATCAGWIDARSGFHRDDPLRAVRRCSARV